MNRAKRQVPDPGGLHQFREQVRRERMQQEDLEIIKVLSNIGTGKRKRLENRFADEMYAFWKIVFANPEMHRMFAQSPKVGTPRFARQVLNCIAELTSES